MAMEKRGVIEPGRTRQHETKPDGEKRAADNVEQLDNDFTKRAADAASERLKEPENGS